MAINVFGKRSNFSEKEIDTTLMEQKPYLGKIVLRVIMTKIGI